MPVQGPISHPWIMSGKWGAGCAMLDTAPLMPYEPATIRHRLVVSRSCHLRPDPHPSLCAGDPDHGDGAVPCGDRRGADETAGWRAAAGAAVLVPLRHLWGDLDPAGLLARRQGLPSPVAAGGAGGARSAAGGGEHLLHHRGGACRLRERHRHSLCLSLPDGGAVGLDAGRTGVAPGLGRGGRRLLRRAAGDPPGSGGARYRRDLHPVHRLHRRRADAAEPQARQ